MLTRQRVLGASASAAAAAVASQEQLGGRRHVRALELLSKRQICRAGGPVNGAVASIGSGCKQRGARQSGQIILFTPQRVLLPTLPISCCLKDQCTQTDVTGDRQLVVH